MPPSARKDTTPTPPQQPTAPPTDSDTPIHNQLVQDLENADPEDVTQFEEDDDPLEHVGDLADDESGADNTEENV